jgi:prevent-host-death family protein
MCTQLLAGGLRLEAFMTVETVNVREVRARLRDLLDKILSGDTDFVIERNGKPIAALIPIGDFEELQEELDDLRAARRAEAAYAEWRRDPSVARPYSEVRAELVEEGLLDE